MYIEIYPGYTGLFHIEIYPGWFSKPFPRQHIRKILGSTSWPCPQAGVDGDDVVIARAGKPLVKLVPVGTMPRKRHLGFMRSQGIASADVKGDFADDINAMFS